MSEANLVRFILRDLQAHGIRFLWGTPDGEAGHFDQETREVRVDPTPSDWLQTLTHEHAHFRQHLEDPSAFDDALDAPAQERDADRRALRLLERFGAPVPPDYIRISWAHSLLALYPDLDWEAPEVVALMPTSWDAQTPQLPSPVTDPKIDTDR